MQVRAGNVKMYHHLLRRMTLVKWVYGAVALTELPLEQFDTFCRPGAALQHCALCIAHCLARVPKRLPRLPSLIVVWLAHTDLRATSTAEC